MNSALPARLLVDDTHAYILTDCEEITLFQPQEKVVTCPWWQLILAGSLNQLSVALTLKRPPVALWC